MRSRVCAGRDQKRGYGTLNAVSHHPGPLQRLPRRGFASGITRSRQAEGFLTAIVGVPLLTILLMPVRGQIGLDTVLLLYLLMSVIASAIGGWLPSLLAAVASFMCANFFFTPPYGSMLVQNRNEFVDLGVFLAVATLVAFITEMGARARAVAERARLEAGWLTELSRREHGPGSLAIALEDARVVFGVNGVSLNDGNVILSQVGRVEPTDTKVSVEAGQGLSLVLNGPESLGEDRRLLSMLATTAGRLWRTEQLAVQARRAEELARIDEVRASLLAAVGHDLRSPLAVIKASVSTLRQDDIHLAVAEQQQLLASIEANADRLNELIANLLDMSRIQAGALSVHLRPTVVEEVLIGALRLGEGRVELEIPDDLPMVMADPGLLERVFANLVDNVRRYASAAESTRIQAERAGRRVLVHVIDHGPGVSPQRFDEIFTPFQRFDDRTHSGVGLGLAICRGFIEAMNGHLIPSVTPGGGLTMTVELEAVDATTSDR